MSSRTEKYLKTREAKILVYLHKYSPVLRKHVFSYYIYRAVDHGQPITMFINRGVKRPARKLRYRITESRKFQRLNLARHTVTEIAATLKPYRYVSVMAIGRAYGGSEEGGWWFDTWEPVSIRRVPVWKAQTALQHLASGSPYVSQPRYRFNPAPADTDPMTDYSDGDMIGATWGDEYEPKLTTQKPRRGSNYSPYC